MPFVKSEAWQPERRCRHREHNPPRMIVLEPGSHTWECPACGERQTITVAERPELECRCDSH